MRLDPSDQNPLEMAIALGQGMFQKTCSPVSSGNTWVCDPYFRLLKLCDVRFVLERDKWWDSVCICWGQGEREDRQTERGRDKQKHRNWEWFYWCSEDLFCRMAILRSVETPANIRLATAYYIFDTAAGIGMRSGDYVILFVSAAMSLIFHNDEKNQLVLLKTYGL